MKYRENTETYRNVQDEINNEALSFLKYTIWGEKAENEGYPQVSLCFENARRNTLARSKVFMDEQGVLNGYGINQTLQDSSACEKENANKLIFYAARADDEGYTLIKDKFLDAAVARNSQADEFERMNKAFVSDELYVSDNCHTHWKCYNCGYVSEGESPEVVCPLCGRNETWFVKMD